MSASPITPELLDAMLSAGPDRKPAEDHFRSIPLTDRASGLAAYLLGSGRGGTQQQRPDEAGRASLAAVLLRGDVSSLGGMGLNPSRGGDEASGGAASELLRGMAQPLLSLFVNWNAHPQCRRQVGHCVAELCLSLSLLGKDEGDAAMGAALNGIGPGCAAADVPSLRLLSALAERSPLALWAASGNGGEALVSLLQGAIANITGAGRGGMEKVEAVLEALVQVGMASQMSAQAAAGGTDQVLLMIQAQTGEADDSSQAVDPKSPAAHLGRACLSPLLDVLARSGGEGSDGGEVAGRCLRHLGHCAAQCPSLLAGDSPTLTSLLRTCLAVARDSPRDDEDEARVALAALEVLATACDVSDIRRRIALTSAMGAAGVENLLQLLLLGEGVGEASAQNGVVRICAELIVNGVDEDVEAWASDPASLQEDARSWDDDDTAVYAESLMESFLRNLGGGAATLPVVLPLVETLLASPADQWQNQRAALSILERCLGAAPVAFAAHVPVAVETALRLASHPCVRVQFQAMQLLGVLCHADSVDADSSPHPVRVRGPYGGQILEAISAAVGSPCSKVSSHASLAIVSYCRGGDGREDCGSSVNGDLLVPYLRPVLAALASGPLRADIADPSNVDAGAITILVRAISAVACLADAAGPQFVPHYNDVMPGLLGCTRFGLHIEGDNVRAAPNAVGHDLAVLRGSAVESATIVGQAVGTDSPEVFVPDAEKIMGVVLPLLRAAENGMDASSVVPMDQLLVASARIATVMGDKYAPFVPAVLPHLLRRALEEAEVSVVEGDEAGLEATRRGEYGCDDDGPGRESVTVALPGMGLRKLVLNTTQMQEKAQAARAVYEHARALGASFGLHAEGCLSAFLPLVGFKYYPDVRTTSAQAIGQVFDSACACATATQNAAMPNQVLPSIAKAITQQLRIEDPEDPEAVFALADALSEVFYAAFRHKDARGEPIAVLGAGEARAVVSQLIDVARACLGRRSAILSSMSGSGGVIPDEDELAECCNLLQSEADLLTELVNSVGFILKSLKEGFVPIFDQLVAPIFGPLLTCAGTADVRARLAAVCLFDDCVEYCGPAAAAKYAPMLAHGVVEGIDDNDDDLKTAAVYGITQIARNAPAAIMSQTTGPIMSRLVQIAESARGQPKDDVDDLSLVENAVSAIASLALLDGAPFVTSSGFDRAFLVDIFLDNLPLQEDEDEARVCHDGLCHLIESGAVDATAQSTRLVRIIGQILDLVEKGDEVATPGTCACLVAVLRKMQE